MAGKRAISKLPLDKSLPCVARGQEKGFVSYVSVSIAFLCGYLGLPHGMMVSG